MDSERDSVVDPQEARRETTAQHLSVVSPTNLQLFNESAKPSLSLLVFVFATGTGFRHAVQRRQSIRTNRFSLIYDLYDLDSTIFLASSLRATTKSGILGLVEGIRDGNRGLINSSHSCRDGYKKEESSCRGRSRWRFEYEYIREGRRIVYRLG
jgi:hypothetical protein